MTSAKNWCFTLNNYTDDEFQQFEALGTELPEPLVYFIFGKEEGESGTPHLQGYIAFTARKTMAFVKGILCNRVHLEVSRGTPQQASDYCKKDGNYQEFGTLPKGKGSRSDLVAVARAIKEGATIRTIAESNPDAIIRYGSGILRLRRMYRPTREHPPQIKVFWGPTGTGKTRRVWEFANQDELWVHPGTQWFDGYDGQKMVLLDDFDGSWFKLSYLLRLLDRYVMPVPVKGDQTWWVPTTIFITSNLQPKEWYPNGHEEHQRALNRRLEEFGTVVHCTNDMQD